MFCSSCKEIIDEWESSEIWKISESEMPEFMKSNIELFCSECIEKAESAKVKGEANLD